jgi:outer membrane protein assembly factor BamB
MGGGSCEWNYSIGYSTSTPVVYNGRVYVGAGGMWGGGYGVTCLNEADGSWRYDTHDTIPTPGIVQSSPAVSVWNGHIYIYFTTNTGPGKAYCFEDNGSALVKQWEYSASNHVLQGMAVSRGMVYFGDDGGYVYALAGICGDVDHNGLVNPLDAMKVYTGDVCSEWAADVDCNHVVNPLDAMKIYTGDLNCCGLA